MVNSKEPGEQEGEQDDGEGDKKRKVAWRNVVNFFFTNFPPEWNKVDLHRLFSEIGEIADVYVARKVSKTGKRFGFARFFRVGNLKALEIRLNRIRIGNFKLRANIAMFEKCLFKSKEGCGKVRWVLDVPSKTDEIPYGNPSSSTNLSSINQSQLHNMLSGKSFVIRSLSDLQSLWSSFNVTDCKVEFLGGSRFTLDFKNQKEGYNFAKSEEETNGNNSEKGEEKEESNQAGGYYDSRSEDLNSSTKNIVVSVNIIDAAGDLLAEHVEPAVGKESHIPARVLDGKNLNFESDIGSGVENPARKKESFHECRKPTTLGAHTSPSETDKDLVGLNLSRPIEKDLKRIISIPIGLGPNGSELISKDYLSHPPLNRSKTTTFKKGQSPSLEKFVQLKKKKMRTMKLFDLVQIHNRKKLMNKLKKCTPGIRSSKMLRMFRQLAL